MVYKYGVAASAMRRGRDSKKNSHKIGTVPYPAHTDSVPSPLV